MSLFFWTKSPSNSKSCKWDDPPNHPTLILSDGGVGWLNCNSFGLIAFGNTITFLFNFLISSAKISVVVVTYDAAFKFALIFSSILFWTIILWSGCSLVGNQ